MLRADGKTLSRYGGGLGEELVGCSVGWRHTGDQEGNVQEVATVVGKVRNFVLGDGDGELTTVCLKHRRLGIDLYASLSATDREHYRQVERRANGQSERSFGVVEALTMHRYFVLSHLEIWEAISSNRVSFNAGGQIGRGRANGHCGLGNHCA